MNKTCVICGKEFEPKKKNYIQITCSPECSKIRWKQKRLDREEKLKALKREKRHQRELERKQKQEQRKPPSDIIRTSFREEELKLALEICRFGAPPAGRCPQCCSLDYRYSVMRLNDGTGLLKAQCRNNDCKYQRYFNVAGKFWTIPVGHHNKAMKEGFDETARAT